MSYGPGDERSRAPVNHQLLPLTSTPAPSCGEPDLPPPRCCNSLAQGEVSRSLRQQRTPRAPRNGLGAPGEPCAEPLVRSALLVPPYLRWARPHCSGTAALHHHVWDTATTCTQEQRNLLSTHATRGTLCLCNWMEALVALGGSQKPCASLPSYCGAAGERQPPLGGAGSPPCREAAGAVVIPARAAAAAHKASAQGRALVFEKSQNRARAEPPLRLRGCARRAPRALGGEPRKLGMSPGCSPAPRCRVTISFGCPLGVPRCCRATGQQSLQGGRGTRSPPRPRGTRMGEPRGCWGKGSSGARLCACCAPAPTSPQLSVGAGGAELLCPRRTRPQPQPHLPRPLAGDVGMDPALGKAPRPPPNPCGVQEKGS